MKKLVLLLALVFVLSGCADTLPETTSDEYEQIVQFAASLLLKYDHDYESGLVAIELPAPTEETTDGGEGDDGDDGDEVDDTVDPTDDPSNPSDSGDSDSNAAVTSQAQSLAEVVGVAGLEFRYAGVLVKPRSNDVLFLFTDEDDQDTDNVLYVMFEVTNTSEADIPLDMESFSLQIRIGYNGGEAANALPTGLDNDLSWFKGDVPAGSSVMLQSLGAVALDDASEIHSVEYYVRDTNGEHKFTY
jgi:uncharacterized protein YceK